MTGRSSLSERRRTRSRILDRVSATDLAIPRGSQHVFEPCRSPWVTSPPRLRAATSSSERSAPEVWPPCISRATFATSDTWRSRYSTPTSGQSSAPNGAPDEEQLAQELGGDLTGEDYGSGSQALYEVDSENSSREPAHV